MVFSQTNRFIEVDFNTLLGTLNLNTWVLILDFLGLGAKIHDHDEVLRLGDNTKLVKALNRKADGEGKFGGPIDACVLACRPPLRLQWKTL